MTWRSFFCWWWIFGTGSDSEPDWLFDRLVPAALVRRLPQLVIGARQNPGELKPRPPPPNNALRVIFNYLSRSIKRERYVGRYHIVDNQWASFNRDLVGNPVKLGKTEPDYGNKIFLRNSPAAKLPLLQGRLPFFFRYSFCWSRICLLTEFSLNKGRVLEVHVSYCSGRQNRIRRHPINL